MDSLNPPLLMAAVVLVVAGVPKIVRPHSTKKALAGVGLPGSHGAVRAMGVAEIAVGSAVLAVGGPLPALATGLMYTAFAAFVAYAIAKGGQSCGCLGSDETPPTRVHLVVDGALAVVALMASTASPQSIPDILQDQPLAGLPLLALIGLGAWFVQLALSALPALSPEVSR